MGTGDDEDEYAEETDALPYYRQPQPPVAAPRVSFPAKIWGGCLAFVVAHFAIYFVLGMVAVGGSLLIKGLIRLGCHGPLTVLADVLLSIVYLVAVAFVILAVSYLAKKVTGDKNF